MEREIRETRSKMLSFNREVFRQAVANGRLPPAADLATSAFVVQPGTQTDPADLWGAIAPNLQTLPASMPPEAVKALRELEDNGRGILRPPSADALLRHKEAIRESVIAAAAETLRRTKKPGAFRPRPYKPKEVARWEACARKDDVWLPPGDPGFVLPLSSRSLLVFMPNLEDELHRWVALGSFLSGLFHALEARPRSDLSLACTTASDQSPDVVPRLEEASQRFSEEPRAAKQLPMFLAATASLFEGTVVFTFVGLERLAERIAYGDGPGVEAEIVKAVEGRMLGVRVTAERLDRDCVPQQKLVWFAAQEESAILHGEDEILSEYLVDCAGVRLRSMVDSGKEHFAEFDAEGAAKVRGALAALREGKVDEAALLRVGGKLGVERLAQRRRLTGAAAPGGHYTPIEDLKRLLGQVEKGNGRLAYLWWNDLKVPDSFLVPL